MFFVNDSCHTQKKMENIDLILFKIFNSLGYSELTVISKQITKQDQCFFPFKHKTKVVTKKLIQPSKRPVQYRKIIELANHILGAFNFPLALTNIIKRRCELIGNKYRNNIEFAPKGTKTINVMINGLLSFVTITFKCEGSEGLTIID